MFILGANASDADREALREMLGLNKPLLDQFVDYFWGILHGDFGTSLTWREPTLTLFAEFFPMTLKLAIAAAIFASILGITLGVFFRSQTNEPPGPLLRWDLHDRTVDAVVLDRDPAGTGVQPGAGPSSEFRQRDSGTHDPPDDRPRMVLYLIDHAHHTFLHDRGPFGGVH